MNLFKLLRILILRNLKEEKFLTFLSILGIALGIGLFTGVKVASDRAITSFESDIKGTTPYANYEVLDISGIDFNEQVYKDIRSLEENSLPVLKTFGYIPLFKDTVDIKGIYSIKAFRYLNPYKRYSLENFYRDLNGVSDHKEFCRSTCHKKGRHIKRHRI